MLSFFCCLKFFTFYNSKKKSVIDREREMICEIQSSRMGEPMCNSAQHPWSRANAGASGAAWRLTRRVASNSRMTVIAAWHMCTSRTPEHARFASE